MSAVGFAKNKGPAIERYKKFVSEGEGQPDPWESLPNQVFLESEQYIEKMRALIAQGKGLSEIPSVQK